MGRKLLVVLSVLVTGISSALFFRKDQGQSDPRQGTLGNPFGQRVERRILAGAAWARKIGGPLPAMPGRAPEPLRVPASATAAILEPNRPGIEAPPIFQKTSVPVGSLLAPIDGIAPADDEPNMASSYEAADAPDAGQGGTHRIIDGDTLTKLASRYLGRADRYLEIFEYNRDLLTSPDLLPIGSLLKIPPRDAKPVRPDRSTQQILPRDKNERLPMVQVPPTARESR